MRSPWAVLYCPSNRQEKKMGITVNEKIRLVFISRAFERGKPPDGLNEAGFREWVMESEDRYNEWHAVPARKTMAFTSEMASLGRLWKATYFNIDCDMLGKWPTVPENYCIRGCAEIVASSRDYTWLDARGAYMFAHGLTAEELGKKTFVPPWRDRLGEMARLLSCAVEYSAKAEGDEDWSKPKYWAFDGSKVEGGDDFAEVVESSTPSAAIKRAANGLD